MLSFMVHRLIQSCRNTLAVTKVWVHATKTLLLFLITALASRLSVTRASQFPAQNAKIHLYGFLLRSSKTQRPERQQLLWQLHQQLLATLYKSPASVVREKLPGIADLLQAETAQNGDQASHVCTELISAVCRAFGLACPNTVGCLPGVPFLLLLQTAAAQGNGKIYCERPACIFFYNFCQASKFEKFYNIEKYCQNVLCIKSNSQRTI